ncbi:DUF3696 domain-containing protein [Hymenobacter sp. J193]|uniref:DUF3696 domain-containing protein n=1 Tax=Hymenobacter sp. J193 TaxID=2898429 RepID=UPI002151B225|nr:DUF3696 domain-containing protein [Hymenobacter sp. J193]MCR5889299.1 DUF3696 domain-containing protein [Hymenobacter sp. J193]
MLNSLRIQNFKSWKDTDTIEFGSLTGFFGTNSSGKTSILQFLLMLKQTVESSDRLQILNLGDERSYVDLGTLYDVVHQRKDPAEITFKVEWKLLIDEAFSPKHLRKFTWANYKNTFESKIRKRGDHISLQNYHYRSKERSFTLQMTGQDYETSSPIYSLLTEGLTDPHSHEAVRFPQRYVEINKFYGMPSGFALPAGQYDQIARMVFEFEQLFKRTYYLGPLREYPNRLYVWGGEQPEGVGNRGEKAVAALLYSKRLATIKIQDNVFRTLEEHVAYWLEELGMIHSFEVRPIAPNRKEYEVRIKRTAESAEVFLTDVGFGVSQLLPVLVLLFYVPEGSTIILEQPEIHLHPAVQAGLADVFIDAIKRRNVQIILESHSEHLLQRLQRRLAEEALPTEQVKLYFTDFVGAASTLTPLDLDEYGNIRNWPNNFFGDSFADASAMMDAELKRREAAGEK